MHVEALTVPLFQYFGWVGGFLLAALFAANWCICAPVTPAPRSDLPLNQRINIRIHTDHRWPERVVFDTTRSAHEANAEPETDIGGNKPTRAEPQLFDAFAEMAAIQRRPRFRSPCPADQAAEREAWFKIARTRR